MADLVHIIKRNDLSPSLLMMLLPQSIILTNATVVFNMRLRGNTTLKINRAPASIVQATGEPSIKYDWQSGDTDTEGQYEAEFEVTYSDNTIETFPNQGYILVSIQEDLG